MLIVTVALLPAFGKQTVEVQTTAQSQAVTKLQALSNQLQSLPRKDRVAFAREAAEELGFHFLEPNSVEGRRLINFTVAKRILQIYASDLSRAEKREQARLWVADADAEVEFVPGGEPSEPLSVKKHTKKRLRIQSECEGVCSNFTILEGSGCIATCQQMACWDAGFGFYIEYSQTMLICGTSYVDFGPNFSENCPCRN